MSNTATRIRECRQRAGLSQAELSSRLSVSRQAVTKWEAGTGLPDVENLKAMARLFDVSVDYLLADDSAAGTSPAVLRQPIDRESFEPYRVPGKRVGSKAHAAVLAAYPQATEVWELARTHVNDKKESVFETVVAFFFDSPFGLVGGADAAKNHDPYYLVTKDHQQLLVRVGAHELESRELNETVSEKTFTIGQDRFRRSVRVR